MGTSSDTYATTTYFTITNGGNMAIGTTSPMASTSPSKLEVAGGVYSLSVTGYFGQDSGIRFDNGGSMKWRIFNCASGGCTNSLYIQDADGNNGVYMDQNGTSWTSSSDRRLKQDIVEMSGVLSRLSDVHPSTFRLINAPEKRQIGVIAQDLQANFPEVVVEDGSGFLGVNYDRIGVIALQGVKELASTTSAFDARLAGLETKNTGMLVSILSSFETLGAKIEQGLITIKNLVADQITAVAGYFTTLETDTLKTKKLCLDDVCITKDELKQLLDKNVIQGVQVPIVTQNPSGTTASSTSETATTTPTSNSGTPTETGNTASAVPSSDVPVETPAPTPEIPTDPIPSDTQTITP